MKHISFALASAFVSFSAFTQVPLVDISAEAARQVVVAEGAKDRYEGHPTSLLADDGKTMFCVWTTGHGGPCGQMARSDDGGLTWTRLDDTLPSVYAQTHRNCPTLQKIKGPDGKTRYFVFSNKRATDGDSASPLGINGLGLGILMSEDFGKTWRERPCQPQLQAFMPPTGCMALKDGSVALFGQHRKGGVGSDRPADDQEIWMATSLDGGLTWGEMRIVASVADRNLCEPCCLRSPDGRHLALLMRENRHLGRSMMCFSSDEGRTWSKPRDTSAALTGDRHEAVQLPDGRYVIAFRNQTLGDPLRGQFTAWVGTWADLVSGEERGYRIRLLNHHATKGWPGNWLDTGYSGVELLADGTVVCTTYTRHFADERQSSVVSTRFKVAETDALAAEARWRWMDPQRGFRRGMGIGGWLTNYKRFNVLPQNHRLGITVGDLEHFDTYITEQDVRRIRGWGFDHIRVGFDQIVMEESPFVYRERTFRRLDAFVDWCAQYGVNVVLNLHKAVGNYCDIQEEVQLLDDRGLQDRVTALWLEIERRYHDRPGVAFELLNEVRNVDPEKWNAFADRMVREIRAKNARRMIVVGSTCWNSAGTLSRLKVWDDPFVAYTYHMYEPFEFTHQRGVLQAGPLRYNRALEYPSSDLARYRAFHELYGNSNAYASVSRIDEKLLAERMAAVVQFRRDHPDKLLWLGEFGTIRHAPPASRVAYMRDVIGFAKAHGIPWSVWNYLSTPNDGNRFSLVDDDTREFLSPQLLAACLGEEPPRRHFETTTHVASHPKTVLPLPTDRAAMIAVFEENVYGRRPDMKGFKPRAEVVATEDVPAFNAVRKEVKINTLTPRGETTFTAVAYIPKRAKPVPLFVKISLRPVKGLPDDADDPELYDKALYPRVPAKELLERGYAFVSFHHGEVFPDSKASFDGIVREPDGWGAISTWALAASRCLDWALTESWLDPSKVAVIGHSRGGKTALWAGVLDTRFALVAVNDSGCSGARLNAMVSPVSEKILDITNVFPYWFAPNYRVRWSGKERELPFDNHQLLALVAPRLLAVGSAIDDGWACPQGEETAVRIASRAWEDPLDVHYHCRDGYHSLRPEDWRQYLDFAESRGWTPPER